MQFNSYIFLFAFLPITLIGFYTVARWCTTGQTKCALVAASLVFYGWYTQWFCLVLIGSTAVTWCTTVFMSQQRSSTARRWACIAGVAGSLGNLLFWKYWAAILGVIDIAEPPLLPSWSFVLPLGISFYSFQQLTYVLDVFYQRARCVPALDYAVFVTFFPQLVIGPIVRHDEMIPQLSSERLGRLRLQNVIVGGVIFVIGLAKKVIIADNLALMVDPVYESAQRGVAVSSLAAGTAGLAYTIQLYADFSGYSDMAIGLGRMFGFRLPANFHSPFKAASISEFWRRWHITLTRIMTPLVYTPVSLTCTRMAMKFGWKGVRAQLMMIGPATLAVFTLIGLWHGPTLPFLLVGVAHAIYVMLEYAWRTMSPFKLPRFMCVTVTFLAVSMSLMCFRAPDLDTFGVMLTSLAGADGLGTWRDIDHSVINILLLVSATTICFLCPNTHQLLGRYRPVTYTYPEHRLERVRPRVRIGIPLAIATGFLFTLSCFYLLAGRATFLYQGF